MNSAAEGYDIQSYLPLFFAPKMTDEAWRAKADYWTSGADVPRDLLRGTAEWCARNNVEYLVHLNHESRL